MCTELYHHFGAATVVVGCQDQIYWTINRNPILCQHINSVYYLIMIHLYQFHIQPKILVEDKRRPRVHAVIPK